MRVTFLSCVVSALIFLGSCSALDAQAPAPAPKAEPKKFSRDDTSVTIPYLLGGIGVILVMVLVCMPARRE
jgi:hypothetical protein